ncbi:hypothetical protein [Pseudomonas sp. MWU12-2323]|uniref:hypothetical protein n=1 Tax=Pseudomonas sp. MWU12-2323 TaxID=2651296 RepID=UPI00128D145D|nr:hypothetical protein [Pseudomonas sp. MWU12-2323]MPQ71472.1 hypothetical protein [Pseudomonas sp. MWU12-2323]
MKNNVTMTLLALTVFKRVYQRFLGRHRVPERYFTDSNIHRLPDSRRIFNAGIGKPLPENVEDWTQGQRDAIRNPYLPGSRLANRLQDKLLRWDIDQEEKKLSAMSVGECVGLARENNRQLIHAKQMPVRDFAQVLLFMAKRDRYMSFARAKSMPCD